MAPPPEFPERRKDHALRRLYNRVEALEKLSEDQAKAIKDLEDKAVTKLWLMSAALTIAASGFVGALKFVSGLEESAKQPLAAQAALIAKQGERMDRFMERQAETNTKTEALYLHAIERRSREEARQTARAANPKE